MATIKSYTDIEQSRKLAKILPIESADMFYADLLVGSTHQYISHHLETYGFETFEDTKRKESKHLSFLPCWSLAALIGVLPRIEGLKPVLDLEINYIQYPSDIDLGATADNPVDACVAMIEKLHELKML